MRCWGCENRPVLFQNQANVPDDQTWVQFVYCCIVVSLGLLVHVWFHCVQGLVSLVSCYSIALLSIRNKSFQSYFKVIPSQCLKILICCMFASCNFNSTFFHEKFACNWYEILSVCEWYYATSLCISQPLLLNRYKCYGIQLNFEGISWHMLTGMDGWLADVQSRGSRDRDNGRVSAAEASLTGRETDTQSVGVVVSRSPRCGAAWKTSRLLCMSFS